MITMCDLTLLMFLCYWTLLLCLTKSIGKLIVMRRERTVKLSRAKVAGFLQEAKTEYR
jgi:hypothetical protein